MPTNVPPVYREAEARFRAAVTREEKLATLEEMLRLVPKHKGTVRGYPRPHLQAQAGAEEEAGIPGTQPQDPPRRRRADRLGGSAQCG